MENTFYVVNEIYNYGGNDAIILNYYTQNKDNFINHIRNSLGLYIGDDYDGSYRYINGYEMFKTDEIELLEYIYEYPYNFTQKKRHMFNLQNKDYDLTIANYYLLLKDFLYGMTIVKEDNIMPYDLLDINNGFLIDCEQGYFIHYLIYFIDKAFDNLNRNELVRTIVKSYTE